MWYNHKENKEINTTIFKKEVTSERQEVVGLRRDPQHREIQRYYVLFLEQDGGYIAVCVIIFTVHLYYIHSSIYISEFKSQSMKGDHASPFITFFFISSIADST